MMFSKEALCIIKQFTISRTISFINCYPILLKHYIMTRQTKLIAGLLAGAAVGSAIALVLASDKNNALKQKASDWFCDLLENSKDKFGVVKNLLSDSLAKVKA